MGASLLGPLLSPFKPFPRFLATGLLPPLSPHMLPLFILSTDLLFKDIRKLEDPQDSAMDHSHQPINPSVHQTLSEMDFERGIWTPAMMGDITTVRQHLRKGIPADVEDMSGYTALHYAARNGHGHICSTLLDAGASIDKPTRAGGSTALHRAAMSGHVDTCDLLLRHGANPCSKDVDGRTPLHRAVERDQREVISLLIETTPATAFVKDNKGKSPLDYAEENDSLFSVFVNIAKN